MTAKIRSDLNGTCFHRSTGDIYLVLDGVLRHVPNERTFNQIFASWKYVDNDNILNEVQLGEPLDLATKVVSVEGRPEIYLLTYSTPTQVIKRHITSMDVMAKYNFKVTEQINQSQDHSIPRAEPIS